MKDVPALLVASLATRDVALLGQVFHRVIDNGRMLRNFVQILRSGAVGRKSLGTRPKKLVQQWLLTASERQLLNACVGNSPSLADVVRMVHPKPAEAWRAAWFAWLIGRPHDRSELPPLTQAFERYKRDQVQGEAIELPDVPFQMLTALPLNAAQWAQIARSGSWQMVRQSLNTFARHGVFDLPGVTEAVAATLQDALAVARSRVLPYQLLATCTAADEKVPAAIRDALETAMTHALTQVPSLPGHVVVCPDVSGSMRCPVTGLRGSASSRVRFVDVAALVVAAVLRRNPQARVLPFEHEVVTLSLNAGDPVLSNARALASAGGGGTNCSAPLALLNRERSPVDLVILVSDNESWVDATARGATQTLREWATLKRRNPNARLVCINIQPTVTAQAAERQDILNIGGFSDDVFSLLARYACGQMNVDHWVGEIEKIALTPQ